MMANVGIPRVASEHSEFSVLLSSPHLNAAATLVLAEKSQRARLVSRAGGPSFVVVSAGF